MKSIKKISDIDKKQKKDNFIFCVSQKMNLFKKTKEKRYFRPAWDEGAPKAGAPDATLPKSAALDAG